MTEADLRPGVVLLITKHASAQFAAVEPFPFRLITHRTYGSTPAGCTWIDGYQLHPAGHAVERRQLFVQIDGLKVLRPPATRAVNRARIVAAAAERNDPPAASIPRPRPASEPMTWRAS